MIGQLSQPIIRGPCEPKGLGVLTAQPSPKLAQEPHHRDRLGTAPLRVIGTIRASMSPACPYYPLRTLSSG